MTKLDIIIVNWNAGDYLRRTVESLSRSECRGFEFGRVVIVDNASSDNSLAFLTDEIGCQVDEKRAVPNLPIEVLQNSSNRGFAAACNQGAANSDADFLLFLNPDVEVEPDTLDRSVDALSSMPDVGALGVQLIDRSGQPQQSCSRFPTPARFTWKALGLDRVAPSVFRPHYLTGFDHDSSRYVDQVMGAYLMTPRVVFKELGGFDDLFFVYFEEVDYCYRLVKNGWTTFFLSSARAYHKGNSTTETVRATRLFYSLRSRIAFGYKHFGRMGAHLQMVSAVTVEFVTRLLHSIKNGSPFEVIEGYQLLWRELPTLTRAPSINMYALASPNHDHTHEVSPPDEVRT